MVDNTIIEALKNSPESKELLESFHNVAVKAGFTQEQYNEARDIVLMMALKNNEEAYSTMIQSTYDKAKGNN